MSIREPSGQTKRVDLGKAGGTPSAPSASSANYIPVPHLVRYKFTHTGGAAAERPIPLGAILTTAGSRCGSSAST